MKAVKCPVCEGSGKYKDRQCHGCDGKGWIALGDYPKPVEPAYTWTPWDGTWTGTGTTIADGCAMDGNESAEIDFIDWPKLYNLNAGVADYRHGDEKDDEQEYFPFTEDIPRINKVKAFSTKGG